MYAIIDTDGVIYGVGSNENEAREYAMLNVDSHLPKDMLLFLVNRMACIPCSQALADEAAELGGNIAYGMVDGVAMTEEEERNV